MYKRKTKSELLMAMRMLEKDLKASHFLTLARLIPLLIRILIKARKEVD